MTPRAAIITVFAALLGRVGRTRWSAATPVITTSSHTNPHKEKSATPRAPQSMTPSA